MVSSIAMTITVLAMYVSGCSGDTAKPNERNSLKSSGASSGTASSGGNNSDSGNTTTAQDVDGAAEQNHAGGGGAPSNIASGNNEGLDLAKIKSWDDIVNAYPIDTNDVATIQKIWTRYNNLMRLALENTCSVDADCTGGARYSTDSSKELFFTSVDPITSPGCASVMANNIPINAASFAAVSAVPKVMGSQGISLQEADTLWIKLADVVARRNALGKIIGMSNPHRNSCYTGMVTRSVYSFVPASNLRCVQSLKVCQ